MAESSTAPRQSFVYDWQTRKLSQWLIPASPEVDLARFVPVTLEYYTARDGTKIPMFVRRPKQCPENGTCPIVVNFHGGPEGQSLPGFSPRAQLYVDEGFVFVEPNVRGSDGYGKTWLAADDGPKRLSVITDIEDCALFIRKHWGKKDGKLKIGIMGGSYGGYSTLVGMTMFAGSYDVGVSNVGMSNLVTFLNNTAPYRRILRISEYGDPQKDKEALEKLSPVTYLDKIKGPLMVIQGANDPRVPVGEALQMFELLQKKKIPSEMIIFADEGHGSQKRDNRALELGHGLRFFKEYLK
jgi:dipeptidyl aminopeptidase/acylaminoacyl peptidase